MNEVKCRHAGVAARAMLLVVVSALAACQSARRDEPAEAPKPLVFPPPPDQPRFYYERSLTSSADVRPFDDTEQLRSLLTGESVTGIGFGKPFDVVSCNGVIFVSDTVARTVMAFDVVGRRFFEIGQEEPGSLSQPLGLNTDDACNLYVADGSAGRINKYTAEGQFLSGVGGKDEFKRLSHVAVSPDGARVFGVDTGGVDSDAHRVRVYDGNSGEYLLDIGARGSGPGQFNLARDAEIGPDGLLYVVDGGNFRIQVFKQDGSFVRTFGAVGRQTGQFSRPKGIAIDKQGLVYVSDAAFGNFQIFDPDGQLMLFIGSRGARPAPAKYMLPAGIDTDPDGRVFMVDQFFRRVDIFRPAALTQEQGALGAWYTAPSN